jgi:hypothetical protein
MPTQFFAVITAAGLAELAAAVSGSYLLNFSEIRVGDGNGAYHNPGGSITHFASNGLGGTRVTSPGHDLVNGESIDISGTSHYDSLPLHFTVSNANIGAGTFDINIAFTVDDAIGQWNRLDLVHQVWPVSGAGGPINAVYVHPDHANWLVIEGYIPAAEGGFTVREVALISPGISGDVVFSVGIVPVSEKPIITDGSVKDLYFRMILVTSNVSSITLVTDPNVVLASQTYVQLFAKWASETERLITGVTFEAPVTQGDAVYYNPSTNKFGQAIADGTIKQRVLGFADISHCCVIRGGYFPWPSPVLTPGSVYYLSTTVLGGITITPPTRYTVEMGVALSTSVMDVMVDDILSAYEDRAMTFDSLGDVGFLRSITAAFDISAGNNIIAGALVQSPNVNVLNQLGVGSAGGFPSLLVDNEGDIYVNGGADNIWKLFYEGTTVIYIGPTKDVYIYEAGSLRSFSVTSVVNAIPIGNSSGKIDPSWFPSGSTTPYPNAVAGTSAFVADTGFVSPAIGDGGGFEAIYAPMIYIPANAVWLNIYGTLQSNGASQPVAVACASVGGTLGSAGSRIAESQVVSINDIDPSHVYPFTLRINCTGITPGPYLLAVGTRGGGVSPWVPLFGISLPYWNPT